MEPNTNPTDNNTQQNLLQNPESSYSDIFTGQRQSPSVELQQQFSKRFSSEHTQTENERLRLRHQKRIEAASQLLRKQELQRNQLIQQLNPLDTEILNDIIRSEKNQLIPTASKKVLPQKIARYEFSIPTPFVFHVITETQKTITTDAFNFTENLVYNSTNLCY